jgi:antitoxin (DNA-binding transcriptional repressor) of toxin-antitoxin stability system
MVTVEELKADLAALVARAEAGERIIITGPDRRPLACLGELPQGVPIPGRGIGKLVVNDAVPDDEHLKDFAEYME